MDLSRSQIFTIDKIKTMTKINCKFLIIPIITTLLLGVSSAKANTISDIATISIKCIIENSEDIDQKYHDAVSD